MVWMTGPWGWLGSCCPPQHLLAVGFPVPGGGCLVGLGFLLHSSQLLGDGLYGSNLGIYRLRSAGGLHTRVPGGGAGGLCSGSGWSLVASEASGLWSRWGCALLPLALPRGRPRPLLSGGGGDKECDLRVLPVVLLGAGSSQVRKGQPSSSGAGCRPSQLEQWSRTILKASYRCV